jgi:hypothetical protein
LARGEGAEVLLAGLVLLPLLLLRRGEEADILKMGLSCY